MKTTLTSLATVALAFGGWNVAFGQVQILNIDGPAPQRVAQNGSDASRSNSLRNDVPNPFDFLDDSASADSAAADGSSDWLSHDPLAGDIPTGLLEGPLRDDIAPAAPAAPSAPSAAPSQVNEAIAPRLDDPNSLPAQRPSSPTLVDTLANHETLANIPHVGSTPIYWGGEPRTPSPVADWLLREHCVEGLWDGYQAQRAAECAEMWGHLSGAHRHGLGCANGCGQSCDGTVAAAGTYNRYTAPMASPIPAPMPAPALGPADGVPAGEVPSSIPTPIPVVPTAVSGEVAPVGVAPIGNVAQSPAAPLFR